jgi:hypothetical protein
MAQDTDASDLLISLLRDEMGWSLRALALRAF